LAVVPAREAGAGGGIEAAAQVRAYRDIRPQPYSCRVIEQRLDLFAELCFVRASALATRREAQLPVRRHLDRAILCDQLMAGRQLEDVLERGARRERRPEGEGLVERDRV